MYYVLTDYRCYYSFVDRDMLMRHFGRGVGHLQYETRHENEPEMAEVESDDNDDVLDAGANLEDDEVGDADIDGDDGGSETDDSRCVHDSDPDSSDSEEGGYGSF